jgi:hypothetical protein
MNDMNLTKDDYSELRDLNVALEPEEDRLKSLVLFSGGNEQIDPSAVYLSADGTYRQVDGGGPVFVRDDRADGLETFSRLRHSAIRWNAK